MHNRDKTACARGHSLTDPDNVRLAYHMGAVRRVCRTCERALSLARYKRRQDEFNANRRRQRKQQQERLALMQREFMETY